MVTIYLKAGRYCMTSDTAWQIFEQTGNVEAYLWYQQLKSEEDARAVQQVRHEPPVIQ